MRQTDNVFRQVPDYLGLKIINCRRRIRYLQPIRLYKRKRGSSILGLDGKEHKEGTREYEKYKKLIAGRDTLEMRLQMFEDMWKQLFGRAFDEDEFPETDSAICGRAEELYGSWDDLKIFENDFESKRHHIFNGVDYDSKSEARIAGIYGELGIPVKHNVEIDIGFRGNIRLDFAALIKERNHYILHEHFGMMDDPDYFNSAMLKIRKFMELGLIPGKDILFTFESSRRPGSDDYYRSAIAGIINANL